MRFWKGDRPGQLREQIRIEEFVATADTEYGGETKAWSTKATVRARADFRPRGSDEIMLSNRKTSRTTCQFTIRRNEVPDITTEMRIIWNGQIFDIDSVLLLEEMGMYQLVEATKREVETA